MDASVKTCTKCQREQDVLLFGARARSHDGLNSWCRKCCSAASTASHKKNPEAVHNAHQVWKRRNPEKNRKDVNLYALRHPDKIRAANRRSRQLRRGRERSAPGSFTVEQMQLLFASYLNRCAYCPNIATSLDHVVPLARGGSNDIENLVPACVDCNLRKGIRSLLQLLVRG